MVEAVGYFGNLVIIDSFLNHGPVRFKIVQVNFLYRFCKTSMTNHCFKGKVGGYIEGWEWE